MKYGEKFSLLRKNRGLTIKIVAEGITSTSSLSRWEKNEGGMEVEKAIKLLNKIGINPAEFFTFHHDQFIEEVNMAYWHHNISKLESLSKQGLKEFHHNPNNFDNLFHATLACNTFLILSKINLFNETDVKKLVFALSNTELWSQEKIELFGSSLMRLPVRKINGIASLIINRAD
jgi:transcriptional regulator with XRE-family HTH domain